MAIVSGSLAELETRLEIADRAGYLGPETQQVIDQVSAVGRMLWVALEFAVPFADA